MKKGTERQFDTVLEQALLLMEGGVDVETIIARFPQHAERLRETLALGPAMNEAAAGVVPPERLLHRIIRVIDAEPVRPTFSLLAASWRMAIPVAVVGTIAALFAILRTPETPPAPLRPLSGETAVPAQEPSTGDTAAGSIADNGAKKSAPQAEIFSTPPTSPAPAPASAPADVPAGAAPAAQASSSDFAAIFNDEDAAFAAGESDATLARSDGSGFDAIGNSYDETTL